MTKVSGSYASVVRGVSQQVAQDRLSGQHTEQVNMVPDPVHGLVRRHGSVTLAEAKLPHNFTTLYSNTSSHRTFSFKPSGVEYDLSYRTGIREVITSFDDTMFCYARGAAQFIPVVIHDTVATQALRHAGVSAITQLGSFLLMTGNAYQTTWSAEPVWNTPENKSRLAVWIRGGAYARTYKMTLTDALTGDKTELTHKTLSASYPQLLDTSALLTSDPDYQKKINDQVNAYNGEVTKWIGTAAESIVPANIAIALKAEYDALGFAPAVVSGSTLVIEDIRWSEVSMDDGGDNSLAEAVGNTIESAEDACPVHFVGKVVKVRPSKESPEATFYLEAHAKDDVSSGVSEVTWREGCAAKYKPDRLFILGVVQDGTLYVSDDLEWLENYIGADTEDDIPQYKESLVGDDLSNPVPNFLGKSIDFLGMIQDRLIVGSGPVLSVSRTGDYFNFFRTTILTIPDDDPFELFSLGSEEDVIKHATKFNRDLILYGEQGQYAISGAQVLTPQTASIVSVSRHGASIDAPPKASGNFAFYATKRDVDGNKVTTLHQIQPAALSDNPESTDVAQQLDGYLQGTAMELHTLTSPNTVLLRTDASRTSVFMFNYLDKAGTGERLLDAWHRWSWKPEVGHLIGISSGGSGDILAFVIRKGGDGAAWLACERFTLSGLQSGLPYMDALRLNTAPGSLVGLSADKLAVAHPAGPNAFEGYVMSQLTGIEDLTGTYRGVLMDAYVTPTNPFPRDRNGQPISFGRLTLGAVRVTVADTGGFSISAKAYNQEDVLLDFNGFIVGASTSVPGTQPRVSQTFQTYIGGEVRECSWTIHSKRWLPLAITEIEWAGQIFNRERRA